MSTTSSSSSRILQFQPFSTVVQPEFWHAFSALKIDRLHLSDEQVAVTGSYTTGRSVLDRNAPSGAASASSAPDGQNWIRLPATVSFGADGFEEEQGSPSSSSTSADQLRVRLKGYIKNYNTVEEFKKADKPAMFDELAAEILQAIATSPNPFANLNKFLVLAFADLKKYKFYHWFAFPALIVQPTWHVELPGTEGRGGADEGWAPAEEVLGADKIAQIARALSSRRRDAGGKGKEKEVDSLDIAISGAVLVELSGNGDTEPELASILHFAQFHANGNAKADETATLLFIDPSSHQSQPGWPLRNLLLLLRVRFGVERIRVIRWLDEIQGDGSVRGKAKSLVGTVFVGPPDEAAGGSAEDWIKVGETTIPVPRSKTSTLNNSLGAAPSATGWERNSSGKLAPKVADLGPLMDPTGLADQAVDLNLKLMRWRIMPEIQLEKVQGTKCLLFGAGTLGCYVARTLLGWGVRNITLIDNAKVSFSNPVRQPLFDFEDCLEGGKPKAPCAAEKLKKIYPGANARGFALNVPMPGHPVPEASKEQTRKDLEMIEKLVEEHDVLFLLMDSRESRWLPSLLGAAKGKLVINAALGFDTYLVMRHGAAPSYDEGKDPSTPPRLGCYFCNDIVAPSDSLVDRTLDQMCTVTRPGLAAIAGASAVELMVSVVQHKDGVHAPASPAQPLGGSDFQSGSCLGLLPHQLRGFLAQFNNMIITGQAYDRCTACSSKVVDEYKAKGHEMLFGAFNEEKYLEKLTGLDKMYEETEQLEADLEVDWDDDEDDL